MGDHEYQPAGAGVKRPGVRAATVSLTWCLLPDLRIQVARVGPVAVPAAALPDGRGGGDGSARGAHRAARRGAARARARPDGAHRRHPAVSSRGRCGRGRGSRARTGLTVLNSPGTIDSDYRGEVQVLLVNLSDAPVTIAPLERIAQLVIAPVARAELVLQLTDARPDGAGAPGGSGRPGAAEHRDARSPDALNEKRRS